MKNTIKKEIQNIINKKIKLKDTSTNVDYIESTKTYKINIYIKKNNKHIFGHQSKHSFSFHIGYINNNLCMFDFNLFIEKQQRGGNVELFQDIAIKIAKKLKIKYMFIDTTKIGRYAWLSRGHNYLFKNNEIQNLVFNNWEKSKAIFPATLTKKAKPNEYPKEYLISDFAPPIINYQLKI